MSYLLPIFPLPVALYLIPLGAQKMSTLAIVLRIVALLAFAGLSLLTVRWSRGQAETRARQHRGDRVPLVANLTALGLLFLSILIFSSGPAGVTALLFALSGALVALAGAFLVVSCHAELGAAWSFAPKADQSTGLITTGPYRLVRHPIYLGVALLAVGEALAFGNWQALFIALSGIVPTLAWRARAEEKLLSHTFGESYEIYRQRTRMIVPHLL